MSETKNIPISQIEPNKGQIEGLPKNPRFIKDARFEALKKSIDDAPEMLALRELIVYPIKGQSVIKYVAICGNMRLRACQQLGYKELPCKVLPVETPVEKLREYTIKDNIGFGADDWDILGNEWNEEELTAWGMELPIDFGEDEQENEINERGEVEFAEILNEEHNYVVLYFDNEVDWLQAESLLDLKVVQCASTRADGEIKDNMRRCGVGRVLKGRETLEKLRKHYENIG